MKLQQSIRFLSILLLPILCYSMDREEQDIVLFPKTRKQLEQSLNLLKIESAWYGFNKEKRKTLSPEIYLKIKNHFSPCPEMPAQNPSDAILAACYQERIEKMKEITQKKEEIIANTIKQKNIIAEINAIKKEIAYFDKPILTTTQNKRIKRKRNRKQGPVFSQPIASPIAKKVPVQKTPLQKKLYILKKLFAAYNVQSQKQLLEELDNICYAIENDSHYTLSDNAVYDMDKQLLTSEIDHGDTFTYSYKTKEFKIIFSGDDTETSD